MDKLKRARDSRHGIVTKTVNEAEAELLKPENERDNTQLEFYVKRLSELNEEVNQLNFKIEEALLESDSTAAALDEEQLKVQEFKQKIGKALINLEKIVFAKKLARSSSNGSINGDESTVNLNRRNYKLPKIELKKFDGTLTEWLGFWAQFQKIDEDMTLHTTDKFQYLVQCMIKGSSARELIESYPQTAENYPKVVAALKERFGRPELLVEVYARDLHKLVVSVNSNLKITLETLYDKLESRLRALESLCTTAETNSVLLFTLVESCLPEEVLRAWNRDPLSKRDGKADNPPKGKLEFLMEFLRQEIQSERRIRLATGEPEKQKKENVKDKPKVNEKSSKIPTVAGLHVGKKEECVFCGLSNHRSEKCFKARDNMTVEDRWLVVRKKHCCFLCFGDHMSIDCHLDTMCSKCQRRHHPMLCNKNSDRGKEPEVKIANTGLACSSAVYLKTLILNVLNRKGNIVKVRALVDDGSEYSYIQKELVQELDLKSSKEIALKHSLFGAVQTPTKHHNIYQVNIMQAHQKKSMTLELLDESKICGRIKRLSMGSWISELKREKIWLSDLGNDCPDIKILIGGDYAGRIRVGPPVHLKNGLTAENTIFGWTIIGKMNEESQETLANIATSLLCQNCNVEDLWNLESIGIMDSAVKLPQQEKDAETQKQFIENLRRESDGRYTVALPWIGNKPQLPDNKEVAVKRLKNMTRKLKDNNYYDLYDTVFNSWIEEGIIEEVPAEELPKICTYLPHRAVIKTESKTTPVRPVFDASCKIGRTPSLNDCLEKGPNLLELIPKLILRFRIGKIGVVSDIRKAFLMINVRKEDRDFLRFLWWNSNGELRVLRHKRVVFGVTSSPYLLGAVIEFHLSQYDEEFKDTVKKLKKSMYVDNCVTSVDSSNEYEDFKTESTEMMRQAGMDLRLWESTAKVGEENVSHDSWTTVLGLKWNKSEDILKCEIGNDELHTNPTKRIILSVTQKPYDPSGFLCPCLLIPKLILQEIWAGNFGWDEELPETIAEKFKRWYDDLNYLKEISLPRNVIDGGWSDLSNAQLHIFCDASKEAYATCAFLRSESGDGVKVQLLMGKSRVAPLQATTIPRLELLACLIGVRIFEMIRDALNLDNIPKFFWSDSTTALAWIQRNNAWGTFVGNRVREILSYSSAEEWRHVPGKLNPADLPSRGCGAKELRDSRWWEGPKWLLESEENWPPNYECTDPDDEEEINREMKKTAIVMTASTSTFDLTDFMNYFSSYDKVIKSIAWLKRFLEYLKCKRNKKTIEKSPYLSVKECEAAEEILVKRIQQKEFADVTDKKLGLLVIRDDKGIIRVKTKLTNLPGEENFKYPMLLPHSHQFVDLLVRKLHWENGHAGAQFLLGKVRERFWILQGRQAIRKIVTRCTVCIRFAARKCITQPAPLPENRVKTVKAFQVSGVDLAGPLIMKNGEKVWIVLFTCAVYRCIHLELVRSLSTEAFLDVFSLFCARRGRPEVVYSDNGTNFVGATNLFKDINWDKVVKETNLQRIQWILNPPSAAWWGGFWERLVRSTKELLRKILGKQKVSLEKFPIYLGLVESVINGRPLTKVTEDDEDLTPLTPAMFLSELPLKIDTEIELVKAPLLRKAAAERKVLLEELKRRFREEYLALLVQKGKKGAIREFRIGEIVLVGDDNKKRWEWILAKIVRLIPGRDGNVRLAEVKTETGKLVRPLPRLFPLEVGEVEYPEEKTSDVTQPVVKTRSGRTVKKTVRFNL